MKPWGRWHANDMYRAGGVALVARELKKAGLLHDERADGRRPHARRDRRRRRRDRGPDVIVPIETPLKPRGGVAVLYGNLAPEGCAVKLAGHDRTLHRGPARVFDSEEETFAAVKAGKIVAGDVVVIRYEGPHGGPGMREMLHVTGGDRRRGPLGVRRARHRRPLLGRHARVHGRPHRARGVEGRAARGAARGRHRRDRRRAAASSTSELSEAELAERLADWVEPEPRYRRGVLANYATLVASASQGAVTLSRYESAVGRCPVRRPVIALLREVMCLYAIARRHTFRCAIRAFAPPMRRTKE